MADTLKKKQYARPPKTVLEHILDHEIEITGTLLSGVFVAYLVGLPWAEKCLFLSYRLGPNAYTKGYNDIYFIAFWVVAFTFLRAAIMNYVYHPLARLVGVEASKRQRLAEQGFAFTYCTIFWTWGMYIMYNSPYWFNTSYYWIDYPHIFLSTNVKSYYLMQTAFWFQQVYTIHAEKRRKDHVAMVSHHFITITLLVSSYCSNFTRIGNAVLCCTDLADILLSLAKCLKYLNFPTLCDIAFASFALAWPITRHIFFSIIIWATITEPHKYLDMLWEPEKGKYFTPFTQSLYIILFVLLNLIMVYWFTMIVKVVVKVIRGDNAEDTRSDSEDDEEPQAPNGKMKHQ
ncbi:longevity assurance proteins LAG1/LAC1 [Hesseltinella vesiculosa]|uniref:Longevity assurance proteins LAG1/LAC1 n=1 Tax=Hesseltinella vesiculosa TaxID=101127 RepID=A0A1X2GHR5_9FUNG|nr:longevity assurance proteins LAG1/LAC1 [Hesseltinella vesiculosa]